MSSIKERIAMFSKKAPSNDEANNPPVTVSNPVSSSRVNKPQEENTVNPETPDAQKAVKRLSVSDRIAGLKASDSAQSSPAAPENTTTPVKRPSISQRIASIKLATSPVTENSVPSSQPAQPEAASAPAPAPAAVPAPEAANPSDLKPETATPPVKRLSVADRIAAMKSPSNESPKPSTPSVNPATPQDGDAKKSSIADRIAAMKAKPTEPEKTDLKPEQSTETPVAKRGSIADKIAAIKSKPEPEKVEEKPKAEASSETTTPPVKRMSVADKIAAMKAKPEPEKVEEKPKPSTKASSIAEKIAAMQAASAAASSPGPPIRVENGENSSTPEKTENGTESNQNTPKTEGTTPSKRLSVDRAKFAAGINLAGFNPMAPRPPMFKPKPNPEEEAEVSEKKENSSVGENGEIQHLNLSRASIPNSSRRKTQSTRYAPLNFDDEQIAQMLNATATEGSAATTIEPTFESHNEDEEGNDSDNHEDS